MSEETKPKESDEVIAVETVDVQMYKDYLRNVSIDDIAKKFGLTPDAVYKIARKNEWKKKRQKAKDLAYKSIDVKYKHQIVDITMFLENDLHLLMQRCRKEKREMTKDERQYVMSLRADATKETRLNEGKPTDITDNSHTVRHEVVLPPGVKRFGVIPPGPNVTQIEAVVETPKEPTPEEKVELDDDET